MASRGASAAPGDSLTAEEIELRERLVVQRAELDAAQLEEVSQ
ncbi:hypothetical protein [Streptomyces sp. NPDC002587]